tara:strand:+ start:57401 stop:57574 length:174 start_codon:yes stop_codon:yes gene_type:complete
MKNKIIDYLTVQFISDKTFKAHYAQRIRSAWICAEKKYRALTKQEKIEILKEIDKKK